MSGSRHNASLLFPKENQDETFLFFARVRCIVDRFCQRDGVGARARDVGWNQRQDQTMQGISQVGSLMSESEAQREEAMPYHQAQKEKFMLKGDQQVQAQVQEGYSWNQVSHALLEAAYEMREARPQSQACLREESAHPKTSLSTGSACFQRAKIVQREEITNASQH